MAITPQGFNQLAKNSGPSSSGVATSYDGLTAGDRSFINGSIEEIISKALGGNQKMGGSNGLLEKLDQKLSNFSESVKKDVVEMFKRLMSKISDYEKKSEDEPCEIDEKQYKKLNQESLYETFDGGLSDKITSRIQVKQKTFLGSKFLNAALNNKHVQTVLNGLKNTGTFIKESVGGLMTTFFPQFTAFITESMTFMKNTTKFMIGISKFVYSSIALMGKLLLRTTFLIAMALFRFTFLVAYIAAQTVFIISSVMFQLVAFFTPIAITIGVIALKLLFLVGVVLIALFIIFAFYHFIKTWINQGFGAAVNELFGGETFRKALEGVFSTLENLLGLQPGTFSNALTMLTSGELYNSIIGWIGDKWDQFQSWIVSSTKQLLIDIGNSVLEKVTSFWTETLKPFFQPVIDGVAWLWGIVKSGWNWLKELPVIGSVLTWMENTFMSGWKILYGWVEAIYKNTIGAIAETTTAILDPSLAGEMAVSNTINENANLMQSTSFKKAMETVMKRKGYPQEQITRMWRLPWQTRNDISNLSRLYIEIQQSAEMLAFSRGGIALEPVLASIGEAGDNEAVIPLNSQGAQFLADAMSRITKTAPMAPIDAKSAEVIKGMIAEEMEISGQSGSHADEIDRKLDSLIKMGSTTNNRTSISVGEDSKGNFIDMIAKGLIE